MAVFGAPQPFADHADRAVRAAIEIDRRVNREGEGGRFELGVGVNSGRVIAGSVGGAGRLNFSVIGDAVNVAARVEAATRETRRRRAGHRGDARAAPRGLRARTRAGSRTLRGIERPVELYALPRRLGGGPARSGRRGARRRVYARVRGNRGED